MSTINTTINHGIVLDTPGYYSPLSITAAGYVASSGTNSAISGAGGTVVNDGRILAAGATIVGGVSGVLLSDSGAVTNNGTITGAFVGVWLQAGGTVTNGGTLIGGIRGLVANGPATLANTGLISGGNDGVNLSNGATVTNGGTISGINGLLIGYGLVTNSGTVHGIHGGGLGVGAGGTIINNASGSIGGGGGYAGINISSGAGRVVNAGTISGGGGIAFGAAETASQTVVDSGTIIGSLGNAIGFGAGNDLLELLPGNLLMQGAIDGGGGADTLQLASGASIGTLTGVGAAFVNIEAGTVDVGAQWVFAGSNTFGAGMTLASSGTLIDTGTLINAGKIDVGTVSNHGLGVAPGAYLRNDASGTIVRSLPGSNIVPAVYGMNGGTSTIVNLGTIADAADPAVFFIGSGIVTNGSTADATALISAVGMAVYGYEGSLSVTNFGTIAGSISGESSLGVGLRQGSVTNGIATRTAALISGYGWAVRGVGPDTTVLNSGTLLASGTFNGIGVQLQAGGTIVNGSADDGAALIQGNRGVVVGDTRGTTSGAAGTVTNYGTIAGTGGTALLFLAASDLLRVAPGAVFTGTVNGGGGTLELLPATGTLGAGTFSGLGSQFINFNTDTIDAGASWVFTGTNAIAAGVALTDSGTLTNTGTLTNGGTFTVAGTLVDTGTIGNGVTLAVGGTLSVAAGGLVTGGATAAVNALATTGTIVFYGGSIINYGTISNTATGATEHGRYAVAVGAGSTVDNHNLITSAGYGAVYVLHGAVNNRGSIVGGSNGVVVETGGAVGNLGLISAAVAGVIANGRMVLNNSGTISGATAAALSNSYVTNSGTLAGTAGAGIQLTQGGTLRNDLTGTVSGSGAYAGLSISGAGTVVNIGTIVGGTGIAIDSAGTASQTVVNFGTIIGNLGTAIALGAGDDLLILAGSLQSFQGLVDGGTGHDTLELAALGGGGTLTGLGTTLVGFETGTVDAGVQWTMAGSNTIGAGMVLTDSGTLTDAGSLINAGEIDVAATATLSVGPGGYLRNEASGTIAQGATANGSSPAVFGMAGGTSTVVNLGTIMNALGGSALDTEGASALYFSGSGAVTNGSTADATAVISGAVGIYGANTNTSLAITNFGTVVGSGGAGPGPGIGIAIGQGSVTNGAEGHTAALITGIKYGILGAYSLVLANFGTVLATGTSGYGIRMIDASTITNGSAGDSTALIRGTGGIKQVGGTVTNFGTIAGSAMGIHLLGTGTVVDAGTITGGSGPAIEFDAGNSLLVLQGGFAITGAITAAGTGNVVELRGSAAAPVVADYNALGLTGFGTVAFTAGNANHATLRITNTASLPGTIAGFIGLHDTVDLATLSDTSGDVVTSFDAGTKALTVTGNGGTVVLQLDTASSYDGLVWVAEDDGAGGTAVHAEPAPALSISGTAAGQAVADDGTLQPFAGVTIADANGAALTETVTITLLSGGFASDADGTLSGTGLTRTGVGTYTLTASGAAAASAAVQGLTFTPTANQVAPGGTVATDFRIDVVDSATASASDGATSVVANSVNDVPTIAGTLAGQAVDDDATVLPFADVVIGDPDAGASETVTITLTAGGSPSDANGMLSGTGLSKTGVGTYTLAAGSPGAVTAALQALVFTPTAGEVAPGDTVTTGMTIAVDDGIAGSPTTDVTTTVVATAVNDAPTISGTVANQGVPDETPSTPFAAVVIGDPDIAPVDTVTVTMSAPGDGAFSNLGGGSYNAATGVYSVTGAPAAVTAALAALVFTPAAPASGLLATTSFTITVQGPGGTVTDTATSVTSAQQVYGLAGAPNVVVSVSPDGSGLPAAVGGQTDEAVILAPTAGGSFAVPDGYRALFLGGTSGVTLSDPGSLGVLLAGNDGNDTIFAGAGSDTVVTGTGANQVVLGAGDAFVASGGSDEIDGGSGAATITAGANDPLIFLGTGTSSVNAGAGGSATVVGSGGNDTIVAHGGALLFLGTAQDQVTTLGADTVVGGSGAAVIATGSNDPLILLGTGTSSVNAAAGGHATVVGTGGNDTIVAHGGAALWLGTARSQVTTLGADTVVGSSGNDTIEADGGALLYLGTAQDQVTTLGADTVVGGSGAAVIATGSNDPLILLGTGTSSVNAAAGGHATVVGTSGNDTIVAHGGAILWLGTARSNVTTLGADTVVAGSGNDTIEARGGALLFLGTARDQVTTLGADTVVGGSGAATITSGANDALILLGAGTSSVNAGAGGHTTVVGGSGAATVQAAGSAFVFAGSGDMLIQTGTDATVVQAGVGAETVVAGSGADLLAFVNGRAATADIQGFDTTQDVIGLQGFGAGEASNALAQATTVGGTEIITLSDGTQITFEGLTNLTTANFV